MVSQKILRWVSGADDRLQQAYLHKYMCVCVCGMYAMSTETKIIMQMMSVKGLDHGFLKVDFSHFMVN